MQPARGYTLAHQSVRLMAGPSDSTKALKESLTRLSKLVQHLKVATRNMTTRDGCPLAPNQKSRTPQAWSTLRMPMHAKGDCTARASGLGNMGTSTSCVSDWTTQLCFYGFSNKETRTGATKEKLACWFGNSKKFTRSSICRQDSLPSNATRTKEDLNGN